jgi:AcrR family transcriptional regulator
MLGATVTSSVRERTVDTRAVRRDATQARILEAAWRLSRRDGLASLSLRELAAEVGMRAPSLYTYFPSKNDLYDAMYAQGLRQLAEELARVPANPNPVEALTQHVRQFAAFGTDDPYRYQLIFERPVPGFVPKPESFAVGVTGLAKIAELAEAAGVRGERGFDLFRALTTGLVGLQVANEPGGDRFIRLVDEAVEMLVAHFASDEGASKRGRNRKDSRTVRAMRTADQTMATMMGKDRK